MHLYGNEFQFIIYQDTVEVDLISGKGADITVANEKKQLSHQNPKQMWTYK
ncbi:MULTISPECIES: hypothetical protein [Lentilactobacillus]|nr:hypothetical protein [Lentilactobacillus parabuchneri]MDB1103014.1 hypothetical protein [Lentilactobacillus parabuchneri]MDN6436336.1 hypothetical protein [Lentilactobacillus parabuchneri]MDN6597075.1 hypothetical protein [Lentilactobacillus parabuchneri]MDN6781949.1 hypothetical protein [Lentilactobacillus parabuchneri]MDN6787549.1 hypothetical protein [Lentilactobacillus parabuchneri]